MFEHTASDADIASMIRLKYLQRLALDSIFAYLPFVGELIDVFYTVLEKKLKTIRKRVFGFS